MTLEFTHFLSDKPLAMGPPAAAFLADKLLVVYEGTSNQRLWYLTGDFNSPNAMPTFSGREHRLTLPNDAGRRGSKPAVGVSPDKRVVVVYEGTNDSRLFYVTARLDSNTGELVGGEHSLTQGDSRRGSTPAIAFDNRGRAVIVYEGTGDNKLFYVTGRLDAAGNLIGSEHLLSQGDSRRGHRPSIAIDATGRVVVVYEGTNDQRLFYVCGRLDEAGVIQGSERSLTQGDARRGTHPTVALDGNGGGVIAYEGTGDRKLFYVKGTFNRSGQLVGDEHLVRIGMSP